MKTKNLNGKQNVVGINIKKYRELKNMSQRELSDKLALYGVNLYHSDISLIERLQLFVRDYELKVICNILGITLDQAYEDTEKFFELWFCCVVPTMLIIHYFISIVNIFSQFIESFFVFSLLKFIEGVEIMDFSDLIAIKIKELMNKQNITIYKLESLSGVYSSTITMFLTRKTKTIRLENLLFICDALKISLSDFFADERFKIAEAKDWKKNTNN